VTDSFRLRRLAAGASQAEVAAMLGTQQSVISKIENGRMLNEHERHTVLLLDELLPQLPDRPAQPVTPEERAAVAKFVREWADREPGNLARQIVADEMTARLKR